MRVDADSLEDTGQRSGGSELGNWINKYQKSDHHADRLVRTIVHYEQTTGQRFPGIYCASRIPFSENGILNNVIISPSPFCDVLEGLVVVYFALLSQFVVSKIALRNISSMYKMHKMLSVSFF